MKTDGTVTLTFGGFRLSYCIAQCHVVSKLSLLLIKHTAASICKFFLFVIAGVFFSLLENLLPFFVGIPSGIFICIYIS